MARNERPLHDNNVCPLCGCMIMCGVDCMRYQATVHAKHCTTCEYFEPMFWHCTYRQEQQKEPQ